MPKIIPGHLVVQKLNAEIRSICEKEILAVSGCYTSRRIIKFLFNPGLENPVLCTTCTVLYVRYTRKGRYTIFGLAIVNFIQPYTWAKTKQYEDTPLKPFLCRPQKGNRVMETRTMNANIQKQRATWHDSWLGSTAHLRYLPKGVFPIPTGMQPGCLLFSPTGRKEGRHWVC